MNESTLVNHEIPLEVFELAFTPDSNNTPTKTSLLWGLSFKFHLTFSSDMLDVGNKKRGGNMAFIRAPAKKESPNN